MTSARERTMRPVALGAPARQAGGVGANMEPAEFGKA